MSDYLTAMRKKKYDFKLSIEPKLTRFLSLSILRKTWSYGGLIFGHFPPPRSVLNLSFALKELIRMILECLSLTTYQVKQSAGEMVINCCLFTVNLENFASCSEDMAKAYLLLCEQKPFLIKDIFESKSCFWLVDIKSAGTTTDWGLRYLYSWMVP